MIRIFAKVESSPGAIIGPGPIVNVLSFVDMPKLSKAGKWSMQVPATDTRAADLLTAQRTVLVYAVIGGQEVFIGGGRIEKQSLRIRNSQPPTLEVQGINLLGELMDDTVGELSLSDTGENNITALVAFAPSNWTRTIEGATPNFQAKLVHETLLGSMVALSDKLNCLFRLQEDSGNPRHFLWRTSPLTTVQVVASTNADPLAAESNENLCLITNIEQIEDSFELMNQGYIYGSGEGENRLELAGADEWPNSDPIEQTNTSTTRAGGAVTIEVDDVTLFAPSDEIVMLLDDGTFHLTTVDSVDVPSESIDIDDPLPGSGPSAVMTQGATIGKPYDGQAPYIWIMDRSKSAIYNIDAFNTYGRRARAVAFKDITPVNNTDADFTAASNFLLLAAINHITLRSVPQYTYRISVVKLDKVILPGDAVRVQARRYVDGEMPIDIDRTLTVLDTTTVVDQRGLRTVSFVASTARRYPQTDRELIASNIARAHVVEAHPQMGPNESTVSYREHVDDDANAMMDFWFGEETTTINRVFVRLRTDPLRSTVKSIGGESTSTGASSATSSGASSISSTPSGGGDVSGAGSNHFHGVPYTGNAIATNLGLDGGGGFASGVSGGQIFTNNEGGHTHTTPNHTHGIEHDHNIEHTHDVTAAIDTVYGIFDATSGETYAPEDLEYRVNGGIWIGVAVGDAISGAAGWYGLDITDSVIQSALIRRPTSAHNTIEFRVEAAAKGGTKKHAQITAQIERWRTIQSVALI